MFTVESVRGLFVKGKKSLIWCKMQFILPLIFYMNIFKYSNQNIRTVDIYQCNWFWAYYVYLFLFLIDLSYCNVQLTTGICFVNIVFIVFHNDFALYTPYFVHSLIRLHLLFQNVQKNKIYIYHF